MGYVMVLQYQIAMIYGHVAEVECNGAVGGWDIVISVIWFYIIGSGVVVFLLHGNL